VQDAADHLELTLDGVVLRFHHIWLRDNCGCPECRVPQSGERRLFTADLPRRLRPIEAWFDAERAALQITWPDGHRSRYRRDWLARHDYSRPRAAGPGTTRQLWTRRSAPIPSFEHSDVVGSTEGQLAYLDAVHDVGAAVVRGTPCVSHEIERFTCAIGGHVRETAFERVHNVRHDATGYNVAHTALELMPHTDMPSYHWPPSIQLLHFLVNEATGGASTLTDGWAVLADLRAQDPNAFETLCRVPVTFQLFSPDEDTRATSPLVQLDPRGEVVAFRFSNQLALPVEADFDDVAAFYDAYQKLGAMVAGGEYTQEFETASGDLLTVHGHRVLHGRRAFDPASGNRHLQDVYLEYDDLMARRRVLRGTHVPLGPEEGL
jgi:gamma-butyrobetaine dioxygenase